MPKVDIVVPCYNYGRYLRPCIKSIVEQSIKDLRILIIDDASSDDSLTIARGLAETDARITVVSHPRNWGHIQTYNQGIAWATADYFLLLSADDLLAPGALERAVEIMDENSDIVLTHGKGVDWQDHLPFPTISLQKEFSWRRQDLVREMSARGANLVATPCAIVRTSVQKLVGEYRLSLPHAGDMEMWLRVAVHGPVASIDDSVQAIYRRHASNMSIPYFSKKLPDFQERKKVFDSFFNEYGAFYPDSLKLHAQAYRMLAKEVYCSGIARICRGQSDSGRELLQFAFVLSPRLRYLPPLAKLATTRNLYRNVWSIFAQRAVNLFCLTRR